MTQFHLQILFAISLLLMSVAVLTLWLSYLRLARRHGECRFALGEERAARAAEFSRLKLAEAEARLARRQLGKAAARFREYEALHLAKGTPDGEAKAASNRAMAELCEEHLGVAGATGAAK